VVAWLKAVEAAGVSYTPPAVLGFYLLSSWPASLAGDSPGPPGVSQRRAAFFARGANAAFFCAVLARRTVGDPARRRRPKGWFLGEPRSNGVATEKRPSASA